ncbi:MAG: hypothetical protein GKS00_06785 [Alphaproteobacteria bacterium]|nr:hypothetical protein [Alphaproteobacteria bacterium]
MTTQLKLLHNTALHDSESDRTAVPIKPSLDMLTAGSRAGGVSVQKAWEIYMAMLRTMPAEAR